MEKNKLAKTILVTGVAGFIGSSLAEELLKQGFKVKGIDCFLANYSIRVKKKNLELLLRNNDFEFVKGNLLKVDLKKLLLGVGVVFHQAALPGVRDSWGSKFASYLDNNVLATQLLLEAAKKVGLTKFIYASSSSVYGEAETLPTSEEVVPIPISPYGVTKLAAENLCRLYWKSFKIPTVSLRYFNAYGPRQRPDMAFAKFIKAGLQGKGIDIYGDGCQTRDFTFIDDIVSANLLAMGSDVRANGEVFNISGGLQISLNDAVNLINLYLGRKLKVTHLDHQKGDVLHTGADTQKALKVLGYKPKVSFEEGILKEVKWLKSF